MPDERYIILRIGINLGDVVGEGSDIFGDGVSIAARLEALAQPGGICVSAKMRDEVQGKIAVTFVGMGLQQLNNISAQVEAFRVVAGPAPVGTSPATIDRLSVAVLPFTHMGGDAADQRFADGLTEDIITELSRSPVCMWRRAKLRFAFVAPLPTSPAPPADQGSRAGFAVWLPPNLCCSRDSINRKYFAARCLNDDILAAVK